MILVDRHISRGIVRDRPFFFCQQGRSHFKYISNSVPVYHHFLYYKKQSLSLDIYTPTSTLASYSATHSPGTPTKASQMLGPRPPCLAIPSTWYADAAVPKTNPAGNARRLSPPAS